MSSLFITGTDTGVGKTVVSAILTLNMNLVYWKPIQCGLDEETDTEFIKRVTKLAEHNIIQELFRLKLPRSPHEAAEAEGLEIHSRNFSLPEIQSKKLLIEGAGGLFVPINYEFMMIDLIKQLNSKVILVCRTQLGTLNHTLMSLEALKSRDIPVLGLILNGPKDSENEKSLAKLSYAPILGHIDIMEEINTETLKKAFKNIKSIIF
jgi:dethiobiotin synthetase